MNERQRFEFVEKKKRIMAARGYICELCERPGIELAHRIPKSKANLRKYGADVVNHDLNLALTCRAHNDYVLVNGSKETKLVQRIREEL